MDATTPVKICALNVVKVSAMRFKDVLNAQYDIKVMVSQGNAKKRGWLEHVFIQK